MAVSAGAAKHSDPVWKCAWVEQSAGRDEALITISTDGRIVQWNTAKVT